MKIYTEDTVVTIAHYHYATNELVKVEEITVQAHTSIPAFTTEVLPGAAKEMHAQVFDTKAQKWAYIEDHRDEKYYSTQDGSEIEIKELGALSENATNQPKPEGFYQWDGNAWIEDLAAKDEAQKQSNIGFLSYETRRTNDAIVVLDDAIEFEVATDEEIVQHKALRKYRLMLSRVTNQETWPLNPIWPECPDFFKQ